MKQSIYSFGQCLICNNFEPLKDGVCNSCGNKKEVIDLPDCFKDLLDGRGFKVEK